MTLPTRVYTLVYVYITGMFAADRDYLTAGVLVVGFIAQWVTLKRDVDDNKKAITALNDSRRKDQEAQEKERAEDLLWRKGVLKTLRVIARMSPDYDEATFDDLPIFD